MRGIQPIPISAISRWAARCPHILLWCVLATVIASCSPDPAGLLGKGQVVVTPVIHALNKYHRDKGRYPEKLDDLVRQSYLKKLPTLPKYDGVIDVWDFNYEVDEKGRLFRFGFSMDIAVGMLPEVYNRSYDSLGNEWVTSRYGKPFFVLVKEFEGQEKLAPIMELLERHKIAHKRYPAALDDLFVGETGTTSPLRLESAKDTIKRAKYAVDDKGTNYRISIPLEIPASVEWDIGVRVFASNSKRWETLRKTDEMAFLKPQSITAPDTTATRSQ